LWRLPLSDSSDGKEMVATMLGPLHNDNILHASLATGQDYRELPFLFVVKRKREPASGRPCVVFNLISFLKGKVRVYVFS
jgi:hypothetical protein